MLTGEHNHQWDLHITRMREDKGNRQIVFSKFLMPTGLMSISGFYF